MEPNRRKKALTKSQYKSIEFDLMGQWVHAHLQLSLPADELMGVYEMTLDLALSTHDYKWAKEIYNDMQELELDLQKQ